MPTYARREGGAYARGETLIGLLARKILVYRDLQAHRAVRAADAERAGERRGLLGRFELDDARDARGAAVMNEAEGMHRAVWRADRQDVLGQGIEVAHSAELLDDFRLHLQKMLLAATLAGYPKTSDSYVVG